MATIPTPVNKPTKAEFLTEKSNDAPSCQIPTAISTQGSNYSYSWNGPLVFVVPIDNMLQKDVPQSIQAQLLYGYHYSRIARHTTQGGMYDTMRREVYWPQMASDLYSTVINCHECARNRAKGAETDT